MSQLCNTYSDVAAGQENITQDGGLPYLDTKYDLITSYLF